MTTAVSIKQSGYEVGVGSKDATRLWESDPTDEGEFARLDVTEDGQHYLTWTDMENHHGSYISVAVSAEDLARLSFILTAQGVV
jgi:hypothetical protein